MSTFTIAAGNAVMYDGLMTKTTPFSDARNKAAAFERQQTPDYEGARNVLEIYLGSLALEEPSSGYNTMQIQTDLGRLYIAEALKHREADRTRLLAAAEHTFQQALTTFASLDLNQQPDASSFMQGKASPRIKGLSAGMRTYRWLADLHTLAAMNPEYNWDPRQDHVAQINAYSEAACDMAKGLGNNILVILECVKTARDARLVGNPQLAIEWGKRASDAHRLVYENEPGRIESADREIGELDAISLHEGALASLSRDVGVLPRDIVLP